MNRRRAPKGYTLLELSVVLVIIALVSGAGLSLGMAQISKTQYETTYKRMSAIEDALLGFRKAKHRLPCPAVGSAAGGTLTSYREYDGGGLGSGNCTGHTAVGTIRIGAVPVQDLGLPDEYLYDGWGQKFSYGVIRSLTANNALDSVPINTGNTYIAMADNFYTGGNNTIFSTNTVYVLISHGPNGHGGRTRNGTVKSAGSTNTYEQQNCVCTAAGAAGANSSRFYIGDSLQDSASSTNNFDDILVFKNRSQLATPEE